MSLEAQAINMMPRTARPISVEPLAPNKMRDKYARCVRVGKTRRDHASGAWSRRLSNRHAVRPPDGAGEPDYSSCNGKGNSSVAFKADSRRHQKGKQ